MIQVLFGYKVAAIVQYMVQCPVTGYWGTAQVLCTKLGTPLLCTGIVYVIQVLSVGVHTASASTCVRHYVAVVVRSVYGGRVTELSV